MVPDRTPNPQPRGSESGPSKAWEAGLWALDHAVRTAIDGGWTEEDIAHEVRQLAKSYRWPGERCKHCTRPVIPGFSVPDAMWAEVVGDENVTLCLSCFDGLAAQKRIAWEDDVDLWPVSSQGWRDHDG